MSDEYDDYCEAWPANRPVNSEDKSPASVVFFISMHVSFMYPRRRATEEDELDINDLVETDGEDRLFDVERGTLINEDEDKSRSTIQDMLSSMDVPERPLMVDKILACARSMASNKIYANHKVLYMNVSISVVSEHEEEEEEEEGEELETEDDVETGPGPASEAAIQELEIVRVEEESILEQCGICLEEFSRGLEARRTSCSHIFHQHCIVDWLHIRNFCPLCRFELN